MKITCELNLDSIFDDGGESIASVVKNEVIDMIRLEVKKAIKGDKRFVRILEDQANKFFASYEATTKI